MILASENSALFCITPTLYVVPSFSIHISNSFVTLPRAPVTTGKSPTISILHNLPNSLFKSWFFSTFVLSFFHYSYISCYSNIDDYPLLLFLVNCNYVWASFLNYFVTLCHKSFTSSFSTAPCETC